ncbi:MAG: hypothetical protein R3182_02870 [Draconibacterium sp.]|nr:hypothetical protein [Draconibacterium sp.]
MKRIIGFSVVVLAVMLFSCQNEKVDAPQDDYLTEKAAQITLTEVQVEAATTETEYEVEFFANAEETLTRWWRIGKRFKWTNKMRYMKECPDVTVDEGKNDGYPKTITLDYGKGTELKNGKVLSGKIIMQLTAPRKSKDYTRFVNYENFGIDTLFIHGSTTSVIDKADSTFRQFTSLLTFTINEETVITRTSERTWHWMEGMDTEDDQTDDVIHITGWVDAEMDGEQYRKQIMKDLVRRGDCKYIVDGEVTVTLNNVVLCMMDYGYGGGECDEFALLKITGEDEDKEIDLSKRKMKGKGEKGQKGNGQGNQNGKG